MNNTVVLIDLPVYPKGVVSLSLVSVANSLKKDFNVHVFDMNLFPISQLFAKVNDVLMFGLKVSSQNFEYAQKVSQQVRERYVKAKVVWGGELPTLLPDLCLQYADTVVSGLFEPVATEFSSDLKSNSLKQKYRSDNVGADVCLQNFEVLPYLNSYYNFIGLPLETSRGCTERCIFCMVHTMQKKEYKLTKVEHLRKYMSQYKNKFINIVDYNFGINAEHVIQVASLIKESGAIGWMAEMCIELLDNDHMLAALKASNCKIIYCGLESIEQVSLNSVHKMNTNHIENYERIIRKVQSYGIQIGAGIILGIEGTNKNTFDNLYGFYQRMGIIYAKLTFLTYNPGTKAHEYVKRKGDFITNNIADYDGNRLTYLPIGVDATIVKKGTESFIQRYYSLIAIIGRSFNTRLSFLQRCEFVLFNLCYRNVYTNWIKYDTLNNPANMTQLIDKPFAKKATISAIEKLLFLVRILQLKAIN